MLLALFLTTASIAEGCSLENALAPTACSVAKSAIIHAQSVPAAEFVPCLDPLPKGRTATSATINPDGTEVHLDSHRAGMGAARLHYRQTFDIDGAAAVPADFEGAEAFQHIERIEPGFRAGRHYLFPGGCVRRESDFDPEASTALSIQLQHRLNFIPRQLLNDFVRRTFLDEELQ